MEVKDITLEKQKSSKVSDHPIPLYTQLPYKKPKMSRSPERQARHMVPKGKSLSSEKKAQERNLSTTIRDMLLRTEEFHDYVPIESGQADTRQEPFTK